MDATRFLITETEAQREKREAREAKAAQDRQEQATLIRQKMEKIKAALSQS